MFFDWNAEQDPFLDIWGTEKRVGLNWRKRLLVACRSRHGQKLEPEA
jgi:hypothetical protein